MERSVLFKGLNSAASDLEHIFNIFHGCFEDQLTELSIPGSGPQPVAVALFEHPEDGLDNRPSMVDLVVLAGVLRSVQRVEHAVFDHRSDTAIAEALA